MIIFSERFGRFALATAVVLAGGMATPGAAQDVNQLSRDIGKIERGFWTREFSNELDISDTALTISHTTFTRVEWQEEGVPGRHVTDTLTWTLPLDQISEIRLLPVPGSMILEGSDQDSYCPLTMASFHCADGAVNCDDTAAFYVCRYNAPGLVDVLDALKQQAPQIVVVGAQ